jgi:hypothetical protein
MCSHYCRMWVRGFYHLLRENLFCALWRSFAAPSLSLLWPSIHCLYTLTRVLMSWSRKQWSRDPGLLSYGWILWTAEPNSAIVLSGPRLYRMLCVTNVHLTLAGGAVHSLGSLGLVLEEFKEVGKGSGLMAFSLKHWCVCVCAYIVCVHVCVRVCVLCV